MHIKIKDLLNHSYTGWLKYIYHTHEFWWWAVFSSNIRKILATDIQKCTQSPTYNCTSSKPAIFSFNLFFPNIRTKSPETKLDRSKFTWRIMGHPGRTDGRAIIRAKEKSIISLNCIWLFSPTAVKRSVYNGSLWWDIIALQRKPADLSVWDIQLLAVLVPYIASTHCLSLH